MAIQKVSVEKFLSLSLNNPVLDVRSPGEYGHAHLPNAHSFPLFTDDERKVVGTLYKQQSREKAIKKGLEYFGVKMAKMVEDAEAIIDPTTKVVLVHCWRGGMRSAGVAWLLDLYGFTVYTLAGGYKAFRQWVLQQFLKEYPLIVIGGYTGSGKTGLLADLKKLGENVIDLEQLANHKGSAFGAINMPVQPSQEMFENKLAIALQKTSLQGNNPENEQVQPIYVEDESQRIGLVNVPFNLWKQLRTKPVLFLDIPFEERLDYIVKDYGRGDKDQLVNAVIRIRKRLGGLEAKTAVNFLMEDDIKEAFRILLLYYDKQYQKGLQSREHWESLCTIIPFPLVDANGVARKILEQKTRLSNV